MVPPLANALLLGAYLFLACLVVVQYRRGAISRERLPLLLGVCLTWLSYGLLQVSQDGPVPTGTPPNYALDGLAVVALVVGLYGIVEGWRRRDDGGDDAGYDADG